MSVDKSKVDEALRSWARMIKTIGQLNEEELLVAIKREKARTPQPRVDMVRRLVARLQKRRKDAERARLMA